MRRRRCRGIAAIEFALVLQVCVVMLAACLYYGRLAMSGTVLDRAASDAIRYLATVPAENLRDDALRSAAVGHARSLLEQSLGAAGVRHQSLQLVFHCGLGDCDAVADTNPLDYVAVFATLTYDDAWLGSTVEISSYAEAGRDN